MKTELHTKGFISGFETLNPRKSNYVNKISKTYSKILYIRIEKNVTDIRVI